MQENLVSSFDTIAQDGVVDLQELNSNVSKLVEENDSQKLKKLGDDLNSQKNNENVKKAFGDVLGTAMRDILNSKQSLDGLPKNQILIFQLGLILEGKKVVLSGIVDPSTKAYFSYYKTKIQKDSSVETGKKEEKPKDLREIVKTQAILNLDNPNNLNSIKEYAKSLDFPQEKINKFVKKGPELGEFLISILEPDLREKVNDNKMRIEILEDLFNRNNGDYLSDADKTMVKLQMNMIRKNISGLDSFAKVIDSCFKDSKLNNENYIGLSSNLLSQKDYFQKVAFGVGDKYEGAVESLKDSKLNPSEITKELLKGMSLSQLEAFMKSNLKKITDNHFQSDLVKESYRGFCELMFSSYKEKLIAYSGDDRDKKIVDFCKYITGRANGGRGFPYLEMGLQTPEIASDLLYSVGYEKEGFISKMSNNAKFELNDPYLNKKPGEIVEGFKNCGIDKNAIGEILRLVKFDDLASIGAGIEYKDLTLEQKIKISTLNDILKRIKNVPNPNEMQLTNLLEMFVSSIQDQTKFLSERFSNTVNSQIEGNGVESLLGKDAKEFGLLGKDAQMYTLYKDINGIGILKLSDQNQNMMIGFGKMIIPMGAAMIASILALPLTGGMSAVGTAATTMAIGGAVGALAGKVMDGIDGKGYDNLSDAQIDYISDILISFGTSAIGGALTGKIVKEGMSLSKEGVKQALKNLGASTGDVGLGMFSEGARQEYILGNENALKNILQHGLTLGALGSIMGAKGGHAGKVPEAPHSRIPSNSNLIEFQTHSQNVPENYHSKFSDRVPEHLKSPDGGEPVAWVNKDGSVSYNKSKLEEEIGVEITQNGDKVLFDGMELKDYIRANPESGKELIDYMKNLKGHEYTHNLLQTKNIERLAVNMPDGTTRIYSQEEICHIVDGSYKEIFGRELSETDLKSIEKALKAIYGDDFILDSDFIRRKVTKDIAAGADVSREKEAAKTTEGVQREERVGQSEVEALGGRKIEKLEGKEIRAFFDGLFSQKSIGDSKLTQAIGGINNGWASKADSIKSLQEFVINSLNSNNKFLSLDAINDQIRIRVEKGLTDKERIEEFDTLLIKNPQSFKDLESAFNNKPIEKAPLTKVEETKSIENIVSIKELDGKISVEFVNGVGNNLTIKAIKEGMENGFSNTKQNIYSFQDAIVNKLIAENKFIDLKKINELIVLRIKLSSDFSKDLEEILSNRGKSPSYIELENRFKNQNAPKVEEKILDTNLKVESAETSIKPVEETTSTTTKVETQTKISVEERELKSLMGEFGDTGSIESFIKLVDNGNFLKVIETGDFPSYFLPKVRELLSNEGNIKILLSQNDINHGSIQKIFTKSLERGGNFDSLTSYLIYLKEKLIKPNENTFKVIDNLMTQNLGNFGNNVDLFINSIGKDKLSYILDNAGGENNLVTLFSNSTNFRKIGESTGHYTPELKERIEGRDDKKRQHQDKISSNKPTQSEIMSKEYYDSLDPEKITIKDANGYLEVLTPEQKRALGQLKFEEGLELSDLNKIGILKAHLTGTPDPITGKYNPSDIAAKTRILKEYGIDGQFGEENRRILLESKICGKPSLRQEINESKSGIKMHGILDFSIIDNLDDIGNNSDKILKFGKNFRVPNLLDLNSENNIDIFKVRLLELQTVEAYINMRIVKGLIQSEKNEFIEYYKNIRATLEKCLKAIGDDNNNMSVLLKQILRSAENSQTNVLNVKK